MNAPLRTRSRLRARLRSVATLSAAALAFFLAFETRPRPVPFETLPWLLDFWQLEEHVQKNDPNLQWAIETRTVDPRALHRATVAAIKSARSDEEAERALEVFVRGFHDRHFWIGPPDPSQRGRMQQFVRGRPGPHDSPDYACSFFRFEDEARTDPLFDLENIPGFRALPGGEDLSDFPAGILSANGRRIGVVRIASFRTLAFGDACRRSWLRFRRTVSGSDDPWAETGLFVQTTERLIGGLSGRARQMQLARVDALVVDLRGNRGGNGWSEAAAQIFTRRRLPSQPVVFARAPAHAGYFRDTALRIRRDLHTPHLDSASRALLQESLERARALMTENRSTCDPGDIWSRFEEDKPGENAIPMRCSNLTRTEYRSHGLLDSFDDRISWKWESEYDLSRYGRYAAEIGLYDGALLVAVDRGTGSAAELFAAQLQDWGNAIVVGERTAGAGGGWMFEDKPLVLIRSRLEVHMPDHATYRRDGSNTVAGVEPDWCVDRNPREAPQIRFEKLMRAIAAR